MLGTQKVQRAQCHFWHTHGRYILFLAWYWQLWSCCWTLGQPLYAMSAWLSHVWPPCNADGYLVSHQEKGSSRQLMSQEHFPPAPLAQEILGHLFDRHIGFSTILWTALICSKLSWFHSFQFCHTCYSCDVRFKNKICLCLSWNARECMHMHVNILERPKMHWDPEQIQDIHSSK